MKTLASTVPQLADMDFEALVSGLRGETWNRTQPIYQTVTSQDKVQVFLEAIKL